MPVYEYRCSHCRHKMAVFFRTASTVAVPVCERCGSARISRLFSTFAVRRVGASGAGGDLDETALDGMDQSDPRAMARMMRGMGDEVRDEMGPEFDEMVDRMEAGESLEEIESSMEEGGMGDDGGEESAAEGDSMEDKL